jgi:hypothetical protein
MTPLGIAINPSLHQVVIGNAHTPRRCTNRYGSIRSRRVVFLPRQGGLAGRAGLHKFDTLLPSQVRPDRNRRTPTLHPARGRVVRQANPTRYHPQRCSRKWRSPMHLPLSGKGLDQASHGSPDRELSPALERRFRVWQATGEHRRFLTPLFLIQCESVYLIGPSIAKQKRCVGWIKTQPTTGVPPHISKFLQINNPLLIAAGDRDPEDATIIR